METVDVMFGFVIGVILSALITFLIIMGSNRTCVIPKGNTTVSYEYTTQCRCGDTVEGYQSLVDGFNQEECKSCGYHAEFNK